MLRTTLTWLIATLFLHVLPALAQPAHDLAAQMENPRAPLLRMETSAGDIFLELFPQAAPLNTGRVLELVDEANAYYDNLTFHRSVSGQFIQFGAAERANRPRPATTVADEINARGLGLEQQLVLDEQGRPHPWLNIRDHHDFQQKVLVPLYRNLGINSSVQLSSRQDDVIQRLGRMNLLQLHELQGYRYNGSLPSRRPVAGSVLMANYGPSSNDGELLLIVDDMPWLTATHTVVGRITGGLEIVQQISRGPDASTRIYRVRTHALSTDGDLTDEQGAF